MLFHNMLACTCTKIRIHIKYFNMLSLVNHIYSIVIPRYNLALFYYVEMFCFCFSFTKS